MLGAMRKILPPSIHPCASRTFADYRHLVRAQSAADQLPPVRLRQIDMHAIFVVGEQLPGVSKPGAKPRPNLVPDCVAASSDRRSNRPDHICRFTPQFSNHPRNSLLHDARRGTPPTRMEPRNDPTLHIRDQYRHTISHLDSQHRSRRGGRQTISLNDGATVVSPQSSLPCCYNLHGRPMNLPQSHHRPRGTTPDGMQECRTIRRDYAGIIILGKSKVQFTTAGPTIIRSRRPANSRAEAVPQPLKFRPIRYLHNIQTFNFHSISLIVSVTHRTFPQSHRLLMGIISRAQNRGLT